MTKLLRKLNLISKFYPTGKISITKPGHSKKCDIHNYHKRNDKH